MNGRTALCVGAPNSSRRLPRYLFPLKLPLAVEGAVLVAITGIGALAIYEMMIRPFRIMRILFGLRLKARPRVQRQTAPTPGNALQP
jgi:hypothetical protein